MFNKDSRHLLDLSVQNALDCISENFNHKYFPGGACVRNSLEKCAFAVLIGAITPILPQYNISLGPSITKSSVRPWIQSDQKYRVAALLEEKLKIIGEIALQLFEIQLVSSSLTRSPYRMMDPRCLVDHSISWLLNLGSISEVAAIVCGPTW